MEATVGMLGGMAASSVNNHHGSFKFCALFITNGHNPVIPSRKIWAKGFITEDMIITEGRN